MFNIFYPIKPDKDGYKISSPFGFRLQPKAGWHSGIDFPKPLGEPVLACYRGKVIATGPRGNYGNAILIHHYTIGQVWSLYAHLSKICVKVGDFVDIKQEIGKVGSTGYSTGNHLHFEVRVGTNGIAFAKNPMKYFSPSQG